MAKRKTKYSDLTSSKITDKELLETLLREAPDDHRIPILRERLN